MDQPTQQIDAFAASLIEQRNAALNEAAYWRAEAAKAAAKLATLEAAKQGKKNERRKS